MTASSETKSKSIIMLALAKNIPFLFLIKLFQYWILVCVQNLSCTFIARVFPPMAALWMGVRPPDPLKSMKAPPDINAVMHSALPLRPHASPRGVSTGKIQWNIMISNKAMALCLLPSSLRKFGSRPESRIFSILFTEPWATKSINFFWLDY